MAGSSSEESGVNRSFDGLSNGQQLSGEALAEWRSSEQVENGITSTSPPYWDTEDDDDCGPKPSELYGRYTWKIDKFSQINKRELRSNAFEVGGYKWYILIYPQGCDVCNHLSLFLCVANHDKLLPGWSHFAQFTIAVVNKNLKKSKYSDTLHRFWKKEHDWGWKKFMELSKVVDGFVDADTLTIKAQVQVIRERPDRPFRCLDCQYRRELVRVYLSNVEQICRRFVEERRGRLGKLIEDKVRWSSFCNFWLGIDQNSRRRMSREKSDSILKVVVKHFFIEKEVTSTLVMDSLYSGLKALEGQTKTKKVNGKNDIEEIVPIPVVWMESDTFILVDDVLLLLERAALEPLPPKDEKGPQNRTKDGGSGEDFSKDFIERDERRLTELGRRTIEIFVLAHIFSKIEVAYQEAVAFKRQEELIREEEEAWVAESEQKAKRASEKEKKLKKKQAKQKRNNRRSKDKLRDEKAVVVTTEKPRKPISIDDLNLLKKPDIIEDVSDVSDSVDCVTEAVIRPDSDDRESSPVNWDTDTSEPHPPTEASSSGVISSQIGGKKSPSVMDDSSSTCSTDSLPSVMINGTHRGNSHHNQNSHSSPSRGNMKPRNIQNPEKHSKEKITLSVTPTSPISPSKVSPRAPKKSELNKNAPSGSTIAKKTSSDNSQNTYKPLMSSNSTEGSTVNKPNTQKLTEKPSVVHQLPSPSHNPVNGQPLTKLLTKPLTKPVPPMSRPLSAPLVEVSRPNATGMTTPVNSVVQTGPFLSRSASAAGYLGPDTSSISQPYGQPSYRNAMMGNPIPATSASFSQTHFHSYSNNSIRPSFSFGMMNHQNGSHWMESFQRNKDNTRLSQSQITLTDEFPHLDIINDLLDDGYTNSGPHHLNHQLTVDQNPSTSSCRFDRTQSFHEEFQYGVDFSRELTFQQQPNLHPYVNGNGSTQWQIGGSDLLYGLRNVDNDGYQYHMPHDYSNLTMGVNGYTVYRPSNGQ